MPKRERVSGIEEECDTSSTCIPCMKTVEYTGERRVIQDNGTRIMWSGCIEKIGLNAKIFVHES